MRRLLQRVVGGPLESVLRRLEQSVTLEGQLDLARRLLNSANTLPRTASHLDQRLIGHVLGEASTVLQIEANYHAPVLPSDVPGFRASIGELASSTVAALVDLSESPGGPAPVPLDVDPPERSWEEDADARVALRAGAAATLVSLRLGAAAPADAEDALLGLTRTSAPRVWFLKRGVVHGTGDLLRALLALVAQEPETVLADYTRDVCDRLIRHLEVRREDYLPFRADARPAGRCDELEKLRFTLALLEAAHLFDDARYLNAAMKANDWHSRWVEANGEKRVADDSNLVPVFYLASLSRQEQQVRELAG